MCEQKDLDVEVTGARLMTFCCFSSSTGNTMSFYYYIVNTKMIFSYMFKYLALRKDVFV